MTTENPTPAPEKAHTPLLKLDTALEHAWHLCAVIESRGIILSPNSVGDIKTETEKRDMAIRVNAYPALPERERRLREALASLLTGYIELASQLGAPQGATDEQLGAYVIEARAALAETE